MICGSCAMRMDGAAVLACKVPMREYRGGRERAGDLAARATCRSSRTSSSTWTPSGPSSAPSTRTSSPGYTVPPAGREHVISPRADGGDPQGVALHQLRRLRLGVQRDGVEPGVPRARRRSRRRCASSAIPATARRTTGSRSLNGEHGIWECTRCYFCNERCPKGVDPRDAIAKLGAESIKEGIDRDMGAKHAKWFVDLGQDDGLAARDRARPEDAGDRRVDQAGAVRARPRQASARCRRRSRRTSRRTCASRAGCTTCSARSRADGFAGIVQGEQALAKLAHGRARGRRAIRTAGIVPAAVPAGRGEAVAMKKVAYYKGCLASLSAKELDSSTQALAPQVGLELDRARVGDLLRRRATSTRRSPTTTCT